MSLQEFDSKNTSINSKRIPAIFKKVRWTPNTRNLDIGGGKYDTATKYLSGLGVQNLIYDPYSRDPRHNQNVINAVTTAPADTTTLSNVLNVIKERDNRIETLKLAKRLARVAFITVYEGDKSGVGRTTKPGCWQENRRLAEYLPEVKEVFTEVDKKKGMIIAR